MNILAIVITAILSALLSALLVTSFLASPLTAIKEYIINDMYFDLSSKRLNLMFWCELANLRGDKDFEDKFKEVLTEIRTMEKLSKQ